jgi:uncharacterized protein (TIGR04255 family)
MEIYEKAPISEAALDIRVRGPLAIREDVLDRARDPKYPELFQRPTTLQVRFETNAMTRASSAEATNASFGYSYRSADHLNIYQVRPDGFTHNRLKPYQEWASFVGEAKRLWINYRAIVNPDVVELIGLNYVNDIEVPIGARLDEYLKTYIEVPEDLPQAFNAFSLGYQVTIPGDAGFLTIGQSYGVPKRENFGMIRLNIQTFKPMSINLESQGDELIWEAFELLRTAKTDAFEACITDKVREMIR